MTRALVLLDLCAALDPAVSRLSATRRRALLRTARALLHEATGRGDFVARLEPPSWVASSSCPVRSLPWPRGEACLLIRKARESAFHRTGLHERLLKEGVRSLLLVGRGEAVRATIHDFHAACYDISLPGVGVSSRRAGRQLRGKGMASPPIPAHAAFAGQGRLPSHGEGALIADIIWREAAVEGELSGGSL